MTMTQSETADTETEKRLARLLSFLDTDPANTRLLADAAETALDARRADVTIDLLARYAAVAELPPREIHLAGVAALQLRQFDKAVESFGSLYEGGAKQAPVRYNLAWAHANLKQFDDALEVLDDPTARALPQAAELRVQLLHELGEFDTAGDVARSYISLYPEHRGLMAAVSVLALDLNDEELAAACAAKAGDHPDALTTRGTLALSHERATEALALFETAIGVNPELPRAWVGRGLSKLMTGATAEAPADIDRGAELFGTHLGSWIAAGWGYFVNGDLATSRARFETALALDDTFAETHGSLAVLDLAAGDLDGARRRSDIALRLDRQCYSAALAKSLMAAGGGDPRTARRIFEKAADTPVDASGRTLGQVLARMGLGLS
jgi:tetratricopeptide (TPR) repeat protein